MKPFPIAAASVAVFPSLLIGGALVVMAGALVGWHPFWSEPELTLSEAAALKDLGTMQRVLWRGADPNVPAKVRAGILKEHDLVVTPLEASVGTRTPTAMEFLMSRGARMDSRQRVVITCLAIKDNATEIIDFLNRADRHAPPDCDHVATPW